MYRLKAGLTKPLNNLSFALPQNGRMIARKHFETNHFIPLRYSQKSTANFLVFSLVSRIRTFTSEGGNPIGEVLAAQRIFFATSGSTSLSRNSLTLLLLWNKANNCS